MSGSLEQVIERLFNFDITALLPLALHVSMNFWNAEEGFVNEDGEELVDQIVNIAEEFIERGDQTGIPHLALYLCLGIKGSEAERIGDKELSEEYAVRVYDYIEEAVEFGLGLAYFEIGTRMFNGSLFWEQDMEQGLAFLEKAMETPIIPEVGLDAEAMMQEIKDSYEACLSQYNERQNDMENSSTSSAVATEVTRGVLKMEKQFSKGYYIAAIAAFVGYILVSILLRNEFDWRSAYDISIKNHWLLGVGATLLLNYSVIPLLMMAYFYQKNNGKHSKWLVSLYIIFLVGCYADSFLPYISTGASLSGKNLLNAFLYPTLFLVTHRLLSLLIYAILKRKEGDSDYRIYYGLVLFAPFMAGLLIIAIPFWIIQAVASSNNNDYQTSDSKSSLDLKEEVRKQLISGFGLYNVAVYYDNGWKMVDYWDHGCSLKEVSGEDWRCTYLEDPNGKIYILSTNCPDKTSVYYFN